MVEAGERVIKYEGKIKRSENVILRQCRRDMDKGKWTETRLGKVREDLYKNAGKSKWEVKERDDKWENVVELSRNRVIELERRERRSRLEESAYNEEFIR